VNSFSADPLQPLSGLLDALADRIVDKWLASTATRMVAQTGSPLGPRRHRAAVKRRIQNGEGGAAIVDKRFYLTHQALQEELGLLPKPKPPEPEEPEPAPAGGPPSSPSADAAAYARDLLARLESVRGGKTGGR
jgi:hypothetical protein